MKSNLFTAASTARFFCDTTPGTVRRETVRTSNSTSVAYLILPAQPKLSVWVNCREIDGQCLRDGSLHEGESRVEPGRCRYHTTGQARHSTIFADTDPDFRLIGGVSDVGQQGFGPFQHNVPRLCGPSFVPWVSRASFPFMRNSDSTREHLQVDVNAVYMLCCAGRTMLAPGKGQ